MTKLSRLLDATERFDRRHPAVGETLHTLLGYVLIGASSHIIITVVLDPTKSYWTRLAGLTLALTVVGRVALNDARKETKR
jgi:hypothetical protein